MVYDAPENKFIDYQTDANGVDVSQEVQTQGLVFIFGIAMGWEVPKIPVSVLSCPRIG